ncbi:MAG: hypothetical protein Kow0013_18570 [Pararhodobacter sp.]
MDQVDTLLQHAVGELEKLLNAKNVLGDPIERDGATVVPIVSYGFGFGAGSGQWGGGAPGGQGVGAGGGIKPVGAIIIDRNGARVESVRSTASGMAETLGNLAIRAMGARSGMDRGDQTAHDASGAS